MAKALNMQHSVGQFLLEMIAANQPHLVVNMAVGATGHIVIVPNEWSTEFTRMVHKFLEEKSV